MKIKVSEVGPEGQELDLDMDPKWMARQLQGVASEEKPGNGRAELEVHLVGNTVNVSGKLRASFYVPCSRCLEPALMEMDSRVRMVFARRPTDHMLPKEMELEADDLEFAYYDSDEIDLEPLLREQLILEVPIAPICREDCTPRLSAEGQGGEQGEEAVDPRWAALAKLKKEQEKKK